MYREDGVLPIRKPRYVIYVFAILKEEGGWTWRWGVIPKGRISLFEKLILSPEHLRKFSKISCMAGMSVWGDDVNISMSSAKRATLSSSCPM